jgi:hypothetical protein
VLVAALKTANPAVIDPGQQHKKITVAQLEIAIL